MMNVVQYIRVSSFFLADLMHIAIKLARMGLVVDSYLLPTLKSP